MQLAIVALVACGWGLSNMSDVRPVLAQSGRGDRGNLAALEGAVARNHDDLIAARELAELYVDRGQFRLVIATVDRMTHAVQEDGRVALHYARALEEIGDVRAASSHVIGALNRCATLPPDLAPGGGCDVRTQTQLTIEASAIDRMISWNVTPLSDPNRAALARDISVRPITMRAGVP